jgi:hypothetical protein
VPIAAVVVGIREMLGHDDRGQHAGAKGTLVDQQRRLGRSLHCRAPCQAKTFNESLSVTSPARIQFRQRAEVAMASVMAGQ